MNIENQTLLYSMKKLAKAETKLSKGAHASNIAKILNRTEKQLDLKGYASQMVTLLIANGWVDGEGAQMIARLLMGMED